MKIYEVREDNGECWEDHFSYSLGFFSCKSSAVKYLQEECGRVFDEKRNIWVFEKSKCTDTSDAKCLGCEFYEKTNELNSINLDKDFYDCPQYEDMLYDEFDNSYCEILEHELRD